MGKKGLSVFDAGLPQFINGGPVDSHHNLKVCEAWKAFLIKTLQVVSIFNVPTSWPKDR